MKCHVEFQPGCLPCDKLIDCNDCSKRCHHRLGGFALCERGGTTQISLMDDNLRRLHKICKMYVLSWMNGNKKWIFIGVVVREGAWDRSEVAGLVRHSWPN